MKPLTIATTSTVSKPPMGHQRARQPKTEENLGNADNGRVLLDSGMENSSSSIKTDEDDLPLSQLKDSKVNES